MFCMLLLVLAAAYAVDAKGDAISKVYWDHCTRQPVCEFRNVTLSCPAGQKIMIDGARYGRLEEGQCPNVPKKYIKTDCVGFSFSRDRENAGKICNLKNTCQLAADNSVFGDPCVGTYKYLDICYSCGRFMQITACEGKLLTGFHCHDHPGKVICIHSAFWGRTDLTTCTDQVPKQYINNDHCYSESWALEYALAMKCNKKKSCADKKATNLLADQDPCVSTFKFLTVRFECCDP